MPSRAAPFRLTLLALALGVTLLAGCGDNPAKLLASGKEYLAKGDDKAAVIQFKNALQKEPNNAEARLLLGEAQMKAGDFPSAEKELGRALELGQPPEVVVPLLARVMAEQGKSDEVIKQFGASTLKDAKAQARLQATLGDAYLMKGKLKEAGAGYAAALASDPADAQAQTGQARIQAVEGRMPEALAQVDAVLKAQPAYGPAAMLKVEILMAQGDRVAALQAAEAGAKADPKFMPLRLATISALVDKGDLDAAAAASQEAQKVGKGDLRVTFLDGLIAFRKGDLAKARDATGTVLKYIPEHPGALTLAGAVELQSKQYVQAEDHLRRALARTPNNVTARRLLVATYLRAGQPVKAREVLMPLLEGGVPTDPPLLVLAGETFFANGDTQRASTYFAAAAERDAKPQAAAARTRLGQIALAGGNPEGAFRELEAASAIDPDQIQADLALVNSHLRRKEFDKALAAAKNLQKKQPDNPLSYQVEGMVYVAKQDRPAARKAFEAALQKQPTYLPAAYALASLDLADKNPAQAKARYEAMIAKEPKNEQLYLAMADLVARSGGSQAEIAAVLQKAVEANPASVDARLALVRLNLAKGDAKAAVAAANEAVAAQPTDRRALGALAAAQEAAGDINQAVDALRRLSTLQPDSAEPHVRMAALYVRQKQYDRALEALAAARKLAPTNDAVVRDIVAVQLAAGRPEESLKVAREVQRDKPKAALGYLMEGEILESQNKLAEAEQAYRAGLKAEPTASLVAVRLYATLQKANKKAEAEAFAKRWQAEQPKDVGLRLYLADGEMQARNLKGAAAQYQAVLAVQPDNVVALNNLAWVAGELGDPKAIGYAERALQIAPDSGAVLDTYGVLLVRKGDVDKGVEMLGRAVRLAPNRPEIRLNYAKALIKQGRKADARKELTVLQESKAEFRGKAEVAELLKGL
ncbi:MAG TPA: PEP-CTERM system TPR-repeat protein PrsT [Burkholderiaceae bacterium]|nr:PEP-CTERM system TPR-repeat protein PrsT [Burkholderiaceae bacterium]HPE02545.1 PEP-CTERM system TPR-repeat protein PrsT [Burkholderiaceae bacterium]